MKHLPFKFSKIGRYFGFSGLNPNQGVSESPEPGTTFDLNNKNASITLSEFDFRMTGTGSGQAVKSVTSKSAGKLYFEVERLSGNGGVGFGNASQSLSTWAGNTTNCLALNAEDGEVYSNAIVRFSPGLGSLDNAEIACVALDITALKVWFGINGSYGLGNDPALGLGGYDYSPRSSIVGVPVFILVSGENAGSSYKLRTQAAQFIFPVPTGFGVWI